MNAKNFWRILGYLPMTEKIISAGFELNTNNCLSLKEIVSLDLNWQVRQIGESLVIWVEAMRSLEDADKNGDESRFQLCPDDNRRRVWRLRRQRTDPAFTIAPYTGPQLGVTVWGAISFYSRTPLVIIRGTLTAEQCVNDSLRTVLLPFLLQYFCYIFQKISYSKTALLAIFSDNNPLTQGILDFCHALNNLTSLVKTIVLQCVLAHYRVLSNTKADLLAKRGALVMQKISRPMFFYSVKNLIKISIKARDQKDFYNCVSQKSWRNAILNLPNGQRQSVS
ncbi:transposable element Tc1 transposase [Trichonephila clavipes]|nr:transposable element Tc1 transposase [Trichonephila clavipes]